MANHNFIFDNINDAIPVLMDAVLAGDEVDSRAGKTRELTHVSITLRKPWQREILLPERKASIAAQIAETMWVLAGSNDITWLNHYLPRAEDFSDDGKTWRAGYGPRLRDYRGVDQLAYVVDILRASPGSRQAVATIWDPTVDTRPGKDISCNNWLNFSSRNGELDLHVAIRSNDLMWGWSGINAFEWSALLEIVAGLLGLHIGSLHFSITSLHLYEQHWERAGILTMPEPIPQYQSPPRFDSQVKDLGKLDHLVLHWFEVEEKIRLGKTSGPYIDNFPESMLRNWLRVLHWWWTRDEDLLPPGELAVAAKLGVQPKPLVVAQPSQFSPTVASAGTHDLPKLPFNDYVNALHREKHAAYGDSWKRRGEMLGIMANIARKIDRLGGGETQDETSADTAIDLLIYLAKYRWWLVDYMNSPVPYELPGWDLGVAYSNYTEPVEVLLAELEPASTTPAAELENELFGRFAALEILVQQNLSRVEMVDRMLAQAYTLAYQLHKQ